MVELKCLIILAIMALREWSEEWHVRARSLQVE